MELKTSFNKVTISPPKLGGVRGGLNEQSPYVIDFYCPELRLGIELDGEVHNSNNAETYDRLRTRFLNENKVAILRFKNEIVYQNIEVIVEEIKTFAKEKRGERGCSDLP